MSFIFFGAVAFVAGAAVLLFAKEKEWTIGAGFLLVASGFVLTILSLANAP